MSRTICRIIRVGASAPTEKAVYPSTWTHSSCRRRWPPCGDASGSDINPFQSTGVTPFFRMMLPYFAVSPVSTTAKADFARS